ncbi:alginate export family protein [Flaviflagellibacter deserti]|uniref:Alginate export family protein n=1 Tax=Flaviflagellibacter deserti TaxID=2267266 RepID=A0ABV9YXD0_9HYPH
MCRDAFAETIPATNSDFLKSLKSIPLNPDASWYLSLGGQQRLRFESIEHPIFGLGSPSSNDYLLLRTFLSADVHFGSNLRTFLELASGSAPGWDGDAPPTQDDDIDVLQGFAEATAPLGDANLGIRGGRQEMSFGSSRLVSVRESPNIRRSFDGLRAFYTADKDVRVDAFVVRPVAPETGAFDDKADLAQTFWGLYSTFDIGATGIDFYYLGLERDEARFAVGVADENRQTFGVRIFGSQAGFDWNVEAAFQFGSFGGDGIRAWTVSSNLGYQFMGLPLTPRLGLNADAISGDHDASDGRLETFNPLFPKLPYFSEANLAAPANLLDLQPNLTLWFRSDLTLEVGWNPLWKQAEADAFYAPPLVPVANTGGDGRFIGQQVSATLSWDVDEHLNLTGTYVHFEPGDRLSQVGGRSGDFVGLWAQWTF